MKSIILYLLIFFNFFNVFKSHLKIHELTDSDFESKVNYGKDNQWLLVFYLESCPHCINAKNAINKYSQNLSDDVLKIGYIECNGNIFTCLRFNVTKVPLILLAQNETMFELNQYPSENNIKNFISEEKFKESEIDFPKSFGYIEIIFKVIQETILALNVTMKHFLYDKFGIKFDWGSEHTAILLFILFIFIFIVEYLIVSFFFNKRSKNTKNEDKNKANKDSNSDLNFKNKTETVNNEEEERIKSKDEKKNQ